MPTQAQISRGIVLAFKEAAQRQFLSGKEKLRGSVVGDLRTKQIPEVPAQSANPSDTVIVHVVDVRLLDSPDQAIVRDVLIATQAQQLIATGTIPVLGDTELESGTPVELAYDRSGNLQVIGRLAMTSEVLAVDTYELSDFSLPFSWGLEMIRFSALSGALQTSINNDRISAGLLALDPAKDFSALSAAEIEDIYGLDISAYNTARAAETPPLAPVTAQAAVNIERNKKGQASFPDTFKSMDLFIYVDYFDAIAVGSATHSVPGVGRFATTQVQQHRRGQEKRLVLYGATEFVYGSTDYGAATYTYMSP